MSKRDDVVNCWTEELAIKGKVTAVGDGSAGETLSRGTTGFTNAVRAGNAELDDGCDRARRRPDVQAYLHVVLMVLVGSTTAPADDTPQSKILHEALSKETRDTLQQAMNSAGN